MNVLALILQVLALVLFAVAAAGIGLPRLHLGWAGAAAFTLAVILTGIGAGV